MNRKPVATVLVAALVVLAGCSGGISGPPGGSADDGSTLTDAQAAAGGTDSSTGTVNLYISDEENAIGDFEHLNVTITRVGLKPAGDEVDDADDNETADVDADDDNETDDSEETDDGDEITDETDDTETATSTATSTNTTETDAADADDSDDGDEADEGEEAEDDAEADDGDADSDDGDDSDDGEWVEYEVDNRTVDLTRLQGANATKLSSLDAPNGTYEKVFVYVSDVNGTLKDGSDQRVKLPSGKLQLNSEFTVGNGESVDFVFDITAVKAGQSGKYILKPVISESGTDVDIERVDEEEDEDDDRERDDREDRAESALNATFVEDAAPGENATLRVTRNGSAVENATVEVDDGSTGTTDANGEYVVSIPEDAEELEVTVTHDGAETELEVEFDDDPSTEAASNDGDSGSGATAD